MTDELIARCIRETAVAHADLVDAAARSTPKAWGSLAAHGVMAFRRLAGRAPDETERRAIWGGLWVSVSAAREHS